MRPVNLIPQNQRRAQASGSQSGSAYVVVGLLGVLLVMLVGYVLTSNSANSSQSQAAASRAEADRVEAQVPKLDAFINFAQIKQTRLASVQGVAASRFDWERTLRELSRLMPTGSWLQSAHASVAGVDGAASTAGNSADAGVSSPQLNLVGCTPHQVDVASMMVRMRQMHQASDVELNESSREASEGAQAGVGSCGKLYNFNLTVTFTGPASAVGEAPRGAVRVPASLGGGS